MYISIYIYTYVHVYIIVGPPHDSQVNYKVSTLKQLIFAYIQTYIFTPTFIAVHICRVYMYVYIYICIQLARNGLYSCITTLIITLSYIHLRYWIFVHQAQMLPTLNDFPVSFCWYTAYFMLMIPELDDRSCRVPETDPLITAFYANTILIPTIFSWYSQFSS